MGNSVGTGPSRQTWARWTPRLPHRDSREVAPGPRKTWLRSHCGTGDTASPCVPRERVPGGGRSHAHAHLAAALFSGSGRGPGEQPTQASPERTADISGPLCPGRRQGTPKAHASVSDHSLLNSAQGGLSARSRGYRAIKHLASLDGSASRQARRPAGCGHWPAGTSCRVSPPGSDGSCCARLCS